MWKEAYIVRATQQTHQKDQSNKSVSVISIRKHQGVKSRRVL